MENEILDYRIIMGTGMNAKHAVEQLQVGMQKMFVPGKHRIGHLTFVQELQQHKTVSIANPQPTVVCSVIAVIEIAADGLIEQKPAGLEAVK